jgi:chemotaxis protein methyltransferase CheR
MESEEDKLELSDQVFKKFLSLIHDISGITIPDSKKFMVQGRLSRRMSKINVTSYENYYHLLSQDDQERSSFIDLITTHETYFYRTPRIWNYIADEFIPKWYSQRTVKEPLSIWSAASSTGEEAYTSGIVCESFRSKHSDFDYRILGSDISQEMVVRCRTGEYHGRSVQSLQKNNPMLFGNYLIPTNHEVFKIHRDIIARTKFKQHNLMQGLRQSDKFDLILLRNVLIYFNSEDQEKIVANLVDKLAPKGILIVGESESLSYIKTDLKLVESMIYCHRGR